MEIYVCNDAQTWLWGQHIPLNAWYGQDEKSWWFCTTHGKSKDGTLQLYRYNGTRWLKGTERSKTTRSICAWAEHYNLWWTKCHWFKEEDMQKRLATKRDTHVKRFENMMRHERRHKKGSSGMRLDKDNYYADKLLVEYECSSRPMHDFRQYYN